MKYFKFLLLVSVVTLFSISCKENSNEVEVKETSNASTNKIQEAPPKKKVVAQQLENGNLLSRAMGTPELKTFVSANLTAGTVDMLSNDKGPYTILAPSNVAFENLPKKRWDALINVKNREALTTLVKNHIVKGDFSSSQLLQSLKNNSSFKMETMGGAELTASMMGDDIVIEDASGKKAILKKTDIMASNGKLHVLDEVLSINVK